MTPETVRPMVWRLAILPACGAAAASLLWGSRGDWLVALVVGFIAYCLVAAAMLADSLWLVFTAAQAERARNRAMKIGYDLFSRGALGETAELPADAPGMQRHSLTVRTPNQVPRELVLFTPLDPIERSVRDRLVAVCYWAWSLQRPAEGISGLESEIMVGDNLAFSRPADWVEATNALRDIGAVSKPGQGFKTTWGPNWTPRRTIAFLQSGVPLPLNYRVLRIAVRPLAARALPRPTGPAPQTDDGAGA